MNEWLLLSQHPSCLRDPTITKRMIRINPMRSGDDTVIRILKEAMEKVK